MDIQEQRLVDYWKLNRVGITRRDAMNTLFIGNLPARVFDLREKGYIIDSVWEKNEATGSRFVRYYLTYDPKDPEWSPVDLKSVPVEKGKSVEDFVDWLKESFKEWKNDTTG